MLAHLYAVRILYNLRYRIDQRAFWLLLPSIRLTAAIITGYAAAELPAIGGSVEPGGPEALDRRGVAGE